MINKTMKACIYIGILSGVLMGIGIYPLMHMFPPLDPAMTAAEVAKFYRDNMTGVIVGGIFIIISSVTIMPLLGALAVFIKKIEGEHSPLTWTFVGLSGFAFVTFFIMGLSFTLTAFRPEASDETIRLFSDFSILMLIIPGIIFVGSLGCLGAAIMMDHRANPIMPRWVGYVQIFTAVLTLPAGVVALFKSGPFAWNGELGFWVPTIAFGIWMGVTIWAMFDSLKRGVLEAP